MRWLTFGLGAYGRTSAALPVDASSDVREVLVAYLMADSVLTGLTGGRIKPGILSEGDPKPALTYSVISNPRGHTLTNNSGIASARVQFDCWGSLVSDCVAIKKRLETLLDAFSGDQSGFEILWIAQLDEHDLHEAPVDGSDSWTYRTSSDYRVKYRIARRVS